MKKTLTLVLALAMCCMCFVGCGTDTKPEDKENSSSLMTPSRGNEHSDTDPSTSQGTAAAANSQTTAKQDYDSLNGDKIGWGQGYEKDADGIPTSCTQMQAKLGKYGAMFIGAKEKTIYLTFDQGYENGFTATILDTLKEKKVPATFFLTYDYCKTGEVLIRRMIAEGHTLGNHSQKHKSFPTISVSEAQQDIDFMHQHVKNVYGYDMKVFRFPMGEYSERMLAAVQDYGYKSIFWSFAYKDWVTDAQPDKAESLQKLQENLHPGAIYLLHSVSSTNAAILGDFIDYALAQGYTFAAIA